jgi:hypothetical protein
MEDLERYADYNDTDDDLPREKSAVGLILKILIAVVCISVVGFFAFRVILFNYYPDKVENIYFNEKLTDFYNANGGKIGAFTQGMRAQYDDPDEGNFFADNLIIIPDINQLQVSVRYNTSLIEVIKEKYKIELNPDAEDNFEFSLWFIPFYEGSTPVQMATLSNELTDSKLMYRYYKLVFDDVVLEKEGTEEFWIALQIRIKGVEMKEPYQILIYENTKEYSKTEEYKLSSKESPR